MTAPYNLAVTPTAFVQHYSPVLSKSREGTRSIKPIKYRGLNIYHYGSSFLRQSEPAKQTVWKKDLYH